ncbi:MAG: hypothetical protein EBV83_10665 [Verrucomicrobia bacterium]|nr:hypothetical protein [Verrucomicrobiota bacterium]
MKMENGMFILVKLSSIHLMKYSDYKKELLLKMFHSINSSMFRPRMMKEQSNSGNYLDNLFLRILTGFVLKTARNRWKFVLEE